MKQKNLIILLIFILAVIIIAVFVVKQVNLSPAVSATTGQLSGPVICPEGYKIQYNGFDCAIFDKYKPPPKWIQVVNSECNAVCKGDQVSSEFHCCKRVTPPQPSQQT